MMTAREFHALRDTLAKTLYVGAFDHVVQMLNRNNDSDPGTESHFIGKRSKRALLSRPGHRRCVRDNSHTRVLHITRRCVLQFRRVL